MYTLGSGGRVRRRGYMYQITACECIVAGAVDGQLSLSAVEGWFGGCCVVMGNIFLLA